MVRDFKSWKLFASGTGDLYNGSKILADGVIRSDSEPVENYDSSVPEAVKTLYTRYGLPEWDGAIIGIVEINGIIGANIEFSFSGEGQPNEAVEKAALKTAGFISEETGFDIYNLNDYFCDFDLFIPYDRADSFISRYGRFDDPEAMRKFTDRYYDLFRAYLAEDHVTEAEN